MSSGAAVAPDFRENAALLIAKRLPHGLEENRRRITREAKVVAEKAKLELGGK